MSPDDLALIVEQIELAAGLAKRGRGDAAANAFALVRTMVVSLQDPDTLATRVNGHAAPLEREREHYRSLIAGQCSGPRKVVVLADSLGLPRSDDKSGPNDGADRTYPFMLVGKMPGHQVDSYCQRYFTTRHVLDLLQQHADLGASDDVVIHVGLNDCANRMFREDDRLSLDFLPTETKDKIVAFAQMHRRMLLEHLPAYHYVPSEEFRANVDSILELLRERKARRVVVATIILPPIRFWPSTPGMQRNFARYNLTLMDAAWRYGAKLLDIDRHVWARQHEDVLVADGMHLSEAGHRVFADETAALLA